MTTRGWWSMGYLGLDPQNSKNLEEGQEFSLGETTEFRRERQRKSDERAVKFEIYVCIRSMTS